MSGPPFVVVDMDALERGEVFLSTYIYGDKICSWMVQYISWVLFIGHCSLIPSIHCPWFLLVASFLQVIHIYKCPLFVNSLGMHMVAHIQYIDILLALVGR